MLGQKKKKKSKTGIFVAFSLVELFSHTIKKTLFSASFVLIGFKK